MNMKIRLKNLGILKQAEFSLGDLTIICGENNTGKTYATYALYGFLNSWRGLIDFGVTDTQIQSLITDGGLKIELAQYVEKADKILAEACKRYTDRLDTVFAVHEDRFNQSEFHVEIRCPDIFNKEIERNRVGFATYSKNKGSKELTVALVVQEERGREIDLDYAKAVINFIISDAIFSDSFPNPFISSTERTGATIFRKELNFARNRLFEEMGRADQKIDPRELLFKAYQSYPSPIEENVDFIRELEDITKRKSFIAKEHPEVLADFADIIGGEYTITQNDQLYYTPKGTRLKLTMVESSSAVRSLLDIGFYLHHIAQEGDLIMVERAGIKPASRNPTSHCPTFCTFGKFGR